MYYENNSVLQTLSKKSSQIKDVTRYLKTITIVGNDLVDGKNVFIRLEIESGISVKYVTALKHMATLKGAKMVKDDLF